MAANDKQEQQSKEPTLRDRLAAIERSLVEMPETATQAELAIGLGKLVNLEKAVRKLKTTWTAAVVKAAQTPSLL